MVTALLLGCLLIPIWVFAPNLPLILAGGFLMQFMVQGAWGVIPAHINELSPDTLRGFFPGFAYQLGVLVASGSAYFEARMAHFMSYGRAMGLFALIVLVVVHGAVEYLDGAGNVTQRWDAARLREVYERHCAAAGIPAGRPDRAA